MPTGVRLSVAVALLTVLLAVPVLSAGAGASGHRPNLGAVTAAGRSTAGRPYAPTGLRSPAVARAAAGPTLAERLGRLRGTGASSVPIFPPNPNRPRAAPAFAPLDGLYPNVPAPMGISDFGVGANGSYEYGTQSFEGNLTLTSFSAFTPTNDTAGNETAPDWVLVQLDAVAVNVTLPPAAADRTNGTFWIQNGLHFNGTTVELEDNIWNFSVNASSAIPPTTLAGKGTVVDGAVYVALGPEFTVTAPSAAHPLQLQLWDNVSSASGHTVVTFGYDVGGRSGTYDTVTFGGTASSTSASQFFVDGAKLNPVGLLYDAELVVGGDGNGANVNVVQLNGTGTLDELSSSTYRNIPSAFDFGADTAETALGVAVAYSGTTAQLTAGPSFLVGLWGTGGTAADRIAPEASSGWLSIDLHVTPSYALLFATNATAASGPLAYANYSYAPTNLSGDLATELPPLPPGKTYVFNAWADGYANASVSVDSSGTVPLVLTPDRSTVDAPVYLSGKAQAAEFGAADATGTGYAPAAGTLWLNASYDTLVAPFLRVNDMDYPTFVLLAADAVDLRFVVNGFVQGPSTFNYSTDAGKPVELLGWSQGYFFYYGSGNVSVDNTTISGVPGRTDLPPIDPPSTVEFYDTANVAVGNLTATDGAVGVTALGTRGVRVADLLVEGGAVGLSANRTSSLTVTGANATGDDPVTLVPSTIADLTATTDGVLTELNVSQSATGLVGQGGSGLTISGLRVGTGGTALVLDGTNSSSVSGLFVTGGLAIAGVWANSTHLSFDGVSVNGTGLVLTADTSVAVASGSTTGISSTIVDSFFGSNGGTFTDLAATDGATAVNLLNCSNVNASGIVATNGSTGALIANASTVSGSGYTSSFDSIGLLLENVTVGTSVFSDLATSNSSIAAFVANSSDVDLRSITASNRTLGAVGYFSNSSFQPFPIAAVGLVGDDDVNVTDVTVLNYPFGVWSNATNYLGVWTLVDRYGGSAVALNYTNDSSVAQVFAFSDLLGIVVQNSTDTTVSGSTLDASAGLGLWLVNGKHDTIEDNNFVANNGSSVDGKFNASRLQAYANGTVDSSFHANYWADRSGSGYTINSTAKITDASPRNAFYLSYLEFTESGLRAGTEWSVVLGGENLTTNASVFYLPGWSIAEGALPFTVEPASALPPNPSSGTVSWAGSNVTESIYFGTPPSSSASHPIPLWVWGAVGAGAVAVVGGVLATRGSRPRGGPAHFGPPAQRPRAAPTSRSRPAPRSAETPDWSPDDRP